MSISLFKKFLTWPTAVSVKRLGQSMKFARQTQAEVPDAKQYANSLHCLWANKIFIFVPKSTSPVCLCLIKRLHLGFYFFLFFYYAGQWMDVLHWSAVTPVTLTFPQAWIRTSRTKGCRRPVSKMPWCLTAALRRTTDRCGRRTASRNTGTATFLRCLSPAACICMFVTAHKLLDVSSGNRFNVSSQKSYSHYGRKLFLFGDDLQYEPL